MVNSRTLEKVTVQTGSQHYSIYIKEQLLNNRLLLKYANAHQIYVITDHNVAPLYLANLLECLPDVAVSTFSVPAGEENKSIENWLAIMQDMVVKQLNRDALVIALGGGMVGDLAGFSASCFKRGLPFIQIPTTLLAQVDASIGGKTALNFSGEKNNIGTFYQPKAVFIDPTLLNSLPKREYRAGLSEVIKYALIDDPAFFIWLKENCALILERDPTALAYMIKVCCRHKANIVKQDEKEEGCRALLNLGHTFAHALESVTLYKRWLHGEAVSIGLYCQAQLSLRLGLIEHSDLEQIKALLIQFGLPYRIPKDIDVDALMACFYSDKKIIKSQLRFIILESIGAAKVMSIKEVSLIRSVIEQCIS